MTYQIIRWIKIIFRNKTPVFLLTISSFFICSSLLLLLNHLIIQSNIPAAWQEIIDLLILKDWPTVARGLFFTSLGLIFFFISFSILGNKLLQPYISDNQNILKHWDTYYKRTSGPNIVLIGGGIGTAQLIRGMKQHAGRLSVVVHMTDDGGSAGRLRRYMGTPAFGDIVSNIVALSDAEDLLKDVLLYRFEGERYGKDGELGGHKLGNLLFAALSDISGDLNHAIERVSKIFAVRGKVLPVSLDPVFLHAKTIEGQIVKGEENIDLGKYNGKKVLDTIWYEPQNGQVNPKVLEAIKKADLIIMGPGDLYTSILANLIFKDLTVAIEKSNAMKAYVLNVANKPFETRGYKLKDFIQAFKRHQAHRTFNYIFVNNNQKIPIPVTPEYEGYSYVKYDKEEIEKMGYTIKEGDYLEKFIGGVEGKGISIYHDPEKIAQHIMEVFDKFYKERKMS